MWLIILIQVAVPIALLAVIAFVPQSNRLGWWLTVLAFGMVITFLWVAARWDIVSIYVRTILPVLFLLAVVTGYRRFSPPESPPGKLKLIFAGLANLAVIVLMSGFLWHSFSGYFLPANAIDLRSPLREGRFVVLHGGASPFINAHYHVRPQNHALDILGLNVWGGRAKVFGDARDLENYRIFGTTVFSPCSGQVVVAVDGLEDNIPPQTDTENLAGNHVLVTCEGVEVLLAHFKKGTVNVKAGENVSTDTILGEVGNTGNSSEPHLHLHVEKGGEPGVILDGKAVPFTLEGRFLVRSNTLSFGK